MCVCETRGESERRGREKEGQGSKKTEGEENSREERQNSEGCSVREGEGERVDKIT